MPILSFAVVIVTALPGGNWNGGDIGKNDGGIGGAQSALGNAIGVENALGTAAGTETVLEIANGAGAVTVAGTVGIAGAKIALDICRNSCS